MYERPEIIQLLAENTMDSLEEIVAALDINPRSYNKTELAVIILLFNMSDYPHTPEEVYLELLDGLEQRIHVKDMFIIQSSLWTRDVIDALSINKRRNVARILGLLDLMDDKTYDTRILLNAIEAVKVARTRTLPTKVQLFKSPARPVIASPYRLSNTIHGLSDEETRQYLAFLAMEHDPAYRSSSSSSSSSSSAAAAVSPPITNEWEVGSDDEFERQESESLARSLQAEYEELESQELARRIQAEEEASLRHQYTDSPSIHSSHVAATAAGGSSERTRTRQATAATAAGGSSERTRMRQATAAGGSSESVQRAVRDALAADTRYRLNGPELAELERQSNPDPKEFVSGTDYRYTFGELSDALTVKQGIITTGSMGIHNAFDNFKDLPKALLILKKSSGRKNAIKKDQLDELKKMVMDFAKRMDDTPYLDIIKREKTTVDAYIEKQIDNLIAKVCKFISEAKTLDIKRGGKVIDTIRLNDLLYDVMHILRTMHPYFQTRWVAAFIESNQSAYGDESLSCAAGIVERPICIFAQELKLALGVGSKEELKAEETVRKKNLVKQWIYAYFQGIAEADGTYTEEKNTPELMDFLYEKVRHDQQPNLTEWMPAIDAFLKSSSFTDLVKLYQGKRQRSKRRVLKRRTVHSIRARRPLRRQYKPKMKKSRRVNRSNGNAYSS
jgi:hypothetical protein